MAIQKNTNIIAVALLALVAVLAVAWFLTSSNKQAAATPGIVTSDFAEGVHFRRLASPVVSSAEQTSDDKISVVEFFWYGCPHCQAFEPAVEQWLKSAPEDVAFQQIPVAWNKDTTLHAALFYVAQDAANAKQLHNELFEKIIELRKERDLSSQLEQLAALYSDYGIDKSAVKELLESSQIQAKVVEAERLMRDAEVSSTPTILVDGQWLVLNNEEVGKVGGPFVVLDFLVQKARAAK